MPNCHLTLSNWAFSGFIRSKRGKGNPVVVRKLCSYKSRTSKLAKARSLQDHTLIFDVPNYKLFNSNAADFTFLKGA